MSTPSEDKQSIEDVPSREEKNQEDPHADYPPLAKQISIMASVYIAIFLTMLDQNIISTAVPRITDQFHSLNDVGWYGSAYLLTMCSFQLLAGKLYKFYKAKPLFLIGISIFEIGSLVCGAAPNSTAFIIGRAIAGLGCSGLYSGAMVIMFHIVPLQYRPIYQGFGGLVFALGSVVGPLLGGVFTDKVTWRWCFYINLPVGVVAMLVVFIVLRLPNQKLDTRPPTWLGQVQSLDPIGNLLFFPGIICLILALQWGGTTYSFGNARIIVLLVLFVLLVLGFMGVQIWKQEDGTVPPRIFKQRSIAAASWFGFFSGASMMLILYYLPIWFQAIKNASAVQSSIMLLPMLLSTVICVLGSGVLVSRLGYYTPFMIFSSVVAPIGAGLLCTMTPGTGHAKWIGYQVLFGIGLGCGLQQPLNVCQTVLGRSDIATGVALIMFMRFIGSAILLPVAENIFISRLIARLRINLPGLSAEAVTHGGATQLKNLASGDDLVILLEDYNAALVDVFYIVVATGALTVFGSVLVEWRNLRATATRQNTNARQDESKVIMTAKV